jgi:hypothetical protein
MPPWLPNAEEGTFVGERRLKDHDIEVLRAWADAGAPPGDTAAVAPLEVVEGSWTLGPPDLIVDLPTYTLAAEGKDVYRNVVAAIPVEASRWIESVELRPLPLGVVHHARIMVDSTNSSRLLDERDEPSGFDGMTLQSEATEPGGHFIGWTPGKVTLPPVPDMAWRLDPGTDIVVQLHMRTTGQEEEFVVQVGFYFTDRPGERSPAKVVVSSLMIDIPPGEADYRVNSSYTLPVAVEVLSVYPHAHYLGKSLRGAAVLPNGREIELIDIPDWDFDWQDEYRFQDPISLPRGTAILLEYAFDNSRANPRNPSDPPQRVVFGPSSTDEMAELILQVVPRSADDRAELMTDLGFHHRTQDVAYVAAAAFADGLRALREGRLEAAIDHLRTVLRNQTNHVGAMTALSEAFLTSGDAASALLVGERAVLLSGRRDATALAALAEAQAASGDPEAAVDSAREALRLAWAVDRQELVDSLNARIERYRR